jgi:acetyl esterase
MNPGISFFVEREVARALLGVSPGLLRRMVGPPMRSPEGFTLDLQVQAILWAARVAKQPPLHAGGPAGARRNMERMGPMLDVRNVRDVVAVNRRVGGAAGPLQARIYRPLARCDGPSPALVWFHGGGFVFGSVACYDGLARALASRAGVVVVSVDYRLAPEAPYPAAADDAIAATRWVLAHAAELGIDANAVAVGGDSAGGNLSAVTSLVLRDDVLRPAFQLLVYPATDLTRGFPSHAHFADGFILTAPAMDFCLAQYVPDEAVRAEPRASPLFARDVSGAPPAMVLTAGFDPLRDEGDAYAEKLRAGGIPVEHMSLPGMVHGFMMMAGGVREADRTLDRVACSLRSALQVAGKGKDRAAAP